MSFRLLAAGLLLWALLPLPFTGIAAPPFWIAAAAAALVALRRRASFEPSRTVLNLLGIVFLVLVLAAGGWRVGPLRPLGHLLLLLAGLRVLTVRDRRSFVAALGPTALVWVIAVASSTHVTLVGYLAASAMAGWWAGMRALLMLRADELGATMHAPLPRLKHVVWAGVVVLLLAVPVFLLMPRLRSPWLSAGRGRGSVAGFTTAVELSDMGDIRTSGKIAMVVTAVRGRIEADEVRLRATAFDLLDTGVWKPQRRHVEWIGGGGQITWLEGRPRGLERAAQLEIELLRPEGYLFLPQGSVAVRSPYRLGLDRAGGAVVSRRVRRPVTYTVWLVPGSHRSWEAPDARDLFVPRRRAALEGLARQIVGDLQGRAASARAVERYLRTNFRYSLRGPGRFSSDPVSEFLFRRREGHCELFAGSMVLLLRSIGIPARMVAGYCGGTVSPSGAVLHVRQANAHAWVEAWLGPDAGWRTFDPTPAEGIPGLSRLAALARLRWAFDKVQVVWDRYVLTFGVQEQLDLAAETVSGMLGLLHHLRPIHGVVALACLVVAVLLLWLVAGRSRRRRWLPWGVGTYSAAAAVDALAARLRRRGVEVPPSATPRAIGAAVARSWDGTDAAVNELVELAERELYSRQGMSLRGRQRARELARRIRSGVGRGGAPGTAPAA